MRTLAIDLGNKRVGIAVSDEGGRLATPLETLRVNSAEDAIEHVAKIVAAEDVKRIVIGLPLNMDGSAGGSANDAIVWGKRLKDSLRERQIEMVFVDERLSSFDAEQSMIERKRAGEKITRKRKKNLLDALVASRLLQEFLDGKLPPLKV